MMNKDFADKEAERARQTFSINLRRYMKLKDINIKELAAAIDVPYMTANGWCNGKSYPRIVKMERLAKYFNIRKSDLIENNTIAPNEEDKELLRKLHREIHKRPILKDLFNISLKTTDTELNAVIQMLNILTKGDERR